MSLYPDEADAVSRLRIAVVFLPDGAHRDDVFALIAAYDTRTAELETAFEQLDCAESRERAALGLYYKGRVPA